MKTFNPRGPFLYYDKQYQQHWLSVPKIEKKEEQSFFKLEQFPMGFLSALVIVDHCDFDSLKKVEAVFYGTSDKNSKDYGKKGIVGTGLTMTKTVFVSGEGSEHIGLDNEEYKRMIISLYNNGIEVAAHSLSSKKSFLKNDKTFQKYLKVMQQFKTQTWVDHGYLDHNLTRFGWDEVSKYYSLETFYRYGYRFFWSGIDYSLNAPDGNLNLFNCSGRAGKDYLLKIIKLIKDRRKFSNIIFSFFWDFVGDLIGREAKDDFFFSISLRDNYSPIKRTLKRVFNPLFYFNVIENFFRADKFNSFTEGIFPIYFNKKNYFLSFTSLWINDYAGCYSSKNIDRLIKERGLHIGHNYLSVQQSHYLSYACKKKGSEYYIDDKFQENLDYMSKKQKEGLLWVTNIRDLGNQGLRLEKVRLKEISARELLLENLSNDKINGITISCPFIDSGQSPKVLLNKKPLKTKKIFCNRLFFWFDLKGREKTKILIN